MLIEIRRAAGAFALLLAAALAVPALHERDEIAEYPLEAKPVAGAITAARIERRLLADVSGRVVKR